MPSGRYITADYDCYSERDCFLDIAVYAVTQDFGHSEGLCGNYNDDMSDDQTLKGSSAVDDSEEPVEFATSYM